MSSADANDDGSWMTRALSVRDLYITDCSAADPGNEVCSAAECRLHNEQLKWVLCPGSSGEVQTLFLTLSLDRSSLQRSEESSLCFYSSPQTSERDPLFRNDLLLCDAHKTIFLLNCRQVQNLNKVEI